MPIISPYLEFTAQMDFIYSIISMNYIAIQIMPDTGTSVELQISGDGITFVSKETISGGSITGGIAYPYVKFVLVSGSPVVKVCCNRRYPI